MRTYSKHLARRYCTSMSLHKRIKVEEAALVWRPTNISHAEMKPSSTLGIGQCFHWHPIHAKLWVGVLGSHAIAIRETAQSSEYAILNPKDAFDRTQQQALLHDYFQTSTSLHELYSQWRRSCSRMDLIAAALPGVRVVRQEPLECLVSFILSSNNNIARITKLLQTIRSRYGRYLCSIIHNQEEILHVTDTSLTTSNQTALHLYEFPTLESLCTVSIEEFQSLGLGYRAKYLHSSLAELSTMGLQWLSNMRQQPRNEVQRQLITLSGIGPKVADCIALFSLDQADVIPVDTHVWDIATRDYDAHLMQKSLTSSVYSAVGDIFRSRFGEKAGWAHSVLFAAELPQFSVLLPVSLQEEMLEYRAIKREHKQKKSLKVKKEKS